MPVLILIGVIIFLCKPKHKKVKPRAQYSTPHTLQPSAPVVYDPIKLQREQERQADRARKEAERAKKEQEEKQAALDRIEWAGSMIDKYSALYEQIETELNENPGLTEYKRIQLQKQLLQLEEKIYKYREQQNKAYYIVNK